MSSPCDTCVFYVYQEDLETYECQARFDEDELAAFLSGGEKDCPYYRLDDEYGVVRKQM